MEVASMGMVVGQGCSVNARKIVVIGIVVLLICAMAALVFAFEEKFTTGEFFSIQDIQHHEVFEVTVLAFGLGVFLAATGFAVHHKNQATDLIAYPMITTVPPNYQYQYHYQFRSPTPYQTTTAPRRDRP